MSCLDLKWIFSYFAPNFFKRFVTQLEGTLKIELLSKDVELKGLPVVVFIFFLTCIVFAGKGGPIIVWHPVHSNKLVGRV